MKFTFDYYEHLVRRVEINAYCMADALKELQDRIDNGQLMLNENDFIGAEIKMPLKENFLPQLEYLGDSMKSEDCEDYDLIVDMW